MKIDEGAFIHPSAIIHGNVEIASGASVWPGAVIRGDYNSITVGRYTNIQDNVVIHCSPFKDAKLGEWVTVGHGAVVHGAQVGDYVLVGLRSVLLDGVVVGEGSMIAAGTIVPENTEIPPGSFVSGSPATIKQAKPGTKDKNHSYALSYHLLSRHYAQGEDVFTLAQVAKEMQDWTKGSGGG